MGGLQLDLLSLPPYQTVRPARLDLVLCSAMSGRLVGTAEHGVDPGFVHDLQPRLILHLKSGVPPDSSGPLTWNSALLQWPSAQPL